MKKLFLTTAVIVAACTSASAVEAPSLGDRIKSNWEQNTDRSSWMAPVRHEPAFPAAADDRARARDEGANGANNGKWAGHHHHNSNLTPEQRAAKKAEWNKMTPEQKAAKKSEVKAEHHEKAAKMTPEQRAKIKADRKAKWDAMTPEQKAAWKAKHASKAPAAKTTATPAPSAQ